MSRDNKTTREPSVLGACFYGLIMAGVGAFIGALYLASFPALGMSNQQEARKFIEGKEGEKIRPGEVVYFKGLRSQTAGAWEAKRVALFDGAAGSVDLSHMELNAWLGSKFLPAGATPASGAKPNLLIIPGVPNVYIDQAIVYLSIPTELVMFGSSFDYTVISAVKIVEVDGVNQFQMVSVNVESAGVPLVGFLGKRIVETLLQAYSGTNEFTSMRDAWARVDSVEQTEGRVRLQLR